MRDVPKPEICKRPQLDDGGRPLPGPGQWWVRLPDGPISGHWRLADSWADAWFQVQQWHGGQVFQESMRLIRERYGAAIEQLGRM